MNWQDPEFLRGAWLVGGTLLLSLLLWRLGRGIRPSPPDGPPPRLLPELLRAVSLPLQFAAWYYCLYFAAPILLRWAAPDAAAWLARNRGLFWHLGLVGAFFGFLFQAVAFLDARLSLRLRRTPSLLDDYALRTGAFALRTLIPFLGVVAPVREEMKRWIETSPLWNRKVHAFQVTDADASTMEIRIIADVPNSGASFDMQCAVREKLVTYLQETYPLCLPRNRQEAVVPDPPQSGAA